MMYPVYVQPCCGCVSYAPYSPNYGYAASARSSMPGQLDLRDYGPNPYVVNIEAASIQNSTFRTAIWTGKHFQVTVMSIPVGQDIGLEIHPATDQFIRIEQGQAHVQMGDRQDRLTFSAPAREDDAIMIPAGKWHNVTNTGNVPLKVYVIYAPPEHPPGTVHPTKADAMAAEAGAS